MSGTPDKSTDDLMQELAEAEYLNCFLTTCSFLEADQAYRKSVGDLTAEVPDKVCRDAIERRLKMLEVLQPEILKVKRQEFKELKLLESQLHRLTLSGDVAETGIPDELKLDDLRAIDVDDLTSVVNGFKKLQEMRREILSS